MSSEAEIFRLPNKIDTTARLRALAFYCVCVRLDRTNLHLGENGDEPVLRSCAHQSTQKMKIRILLSRSFCSHV
jgi:hypothetical protein